MGNSQSHLTKAEDESNRPIPRKASGNIGRLADEQLQQSSATTGAPAHEQSPGMMTGDPFPDELA